MNVKEKIKASSKKIIAGAVAAVTLASSLPLQAFAEEVIMPIANGDAKYTLWGASLSPSDGSAISNNDYYYLDFTEDADGYKMLHEGSHNANRLLVCDSPTADNGVMGVCVGCGLEFKGDYTAGVFVYQDSVAIDSVGSDFLMNEPTVTENNGALQRKNTQQKTIFTKPDLSETRRPARSTRTVRGIPSRTLASMSNGTLPHGGEKSIFLDLEQALFKPH